MRADALIDRMIRENVQFHVYDGVPASLRLSEPALRLLARLVEPEHRTLETGSGASTVVLASSAAHHTAISPASDEHARIRAFLESAGVATDHLRFVDGRSDDMLPALSDALVELVLIDGRHAFPHPVIDWHYGARRLRAGGLLVLDDVWMPSVGILGRFMRGDPGWALVDRLGARTLVFRKLADEPAREHWDRQPFNARPDFSSLRAWQRPLYAARHQAAAMRSRLDRPRAQR